MTQASHDGGTTIHTIHHVRQCSQSAASGLSLPYRSRVFRCFLKRMQVIVEARALVSLSVGRGRGGAREARETRVK